MFFNPSNDNEPTEAWMEFEGSEVFEWALKHLPELVWRLKSYWSPSENRELGVSNFIWYIKFERSFRNEERRLRLVET